MAVFRQKKRGVSPDVLDGLVGVFPRGNTTGVRLGPLWPDPPRGGGDPGSRGSSGAPRPPLGWIVPLPTAVLRRVVADGGTDSTRRSGGEKSYVMTNAPVGEGFAVYAFRLGVCVNEGDVPRGSTRAVVLLDAVGLCWMMVYN